MPLKPLHTLESMESDAYAEAWLTGPHSTQFYTRTYRVPSDSSSESKAIMVFIHGFTEHIGRYTEVHAEFARRGINVFTFDQRGFGRTALDEEHRSEGSAYGKTDVDKQMDDVEWALTHATTLFPSLPLFLAGHSMGGGEALNFPIRRPPTSPTSPTSPTARLRGVIPCSPIVLTTSPHPYFRYWTPARSAAGEDPYARTDTGRRVAHAGLTHDAVFNEMCKGDALHRGYGTVRHVSEFIGWGAELLEEGYVKWPRTLPILIVHGTEDVLTSHDASRDLIAKLPADDKRFISYPNGRHELFHEPAHGQSVVDEIVGFVEGHLS